MSRIVATAESTGTFTVAAVPAADDAAPAGGASAAPPSSFARCAAGLADACARRGAVRGGKWCLCVCVCACAPRVSSCARRDGTEPFERHGSTRDGAAWAAAAAPSHASHAGAQGGRRQTTRRRCAVGAGAQGVPRSARARAGRSRPRRATIGAPERGAARKAGGVGGSGPDLALRVAVRRLGRDGRRSLLAREPRRQRRGRGRRGGGVDRLHVIDGLVALEGREEVEVHCPCGARGRVQSRGAVVVGDEETQEVTKVTYEWTT